MPSFLPELNAQSHFASSQIAEIPSLLISLGVFLALLVTLTLVFKSRAHKKSKKFDVESDRRISPSEELQSRESSQPDDVKEILADTTSSWLQRLKSGLDKTRQNITNNIVQALSKKAVFDEQLMEQIHEILYRSDMGSEMADYLVDQLRREFAGKQSPDWQDVSRILDQAVRSVMTQEEVQEVSNNQSTPHVILVVGVNGVGKTTSIGKLTAHFISQGKSVLLCAGDTYRAAAIEQLQIWGQRLNVPVISHQQGADPASVAFDGVKAAKARNVDILLIDTAGRLHNKQELMDELAKVNRVIGKELPGAPHETFLVIDATTGQNAFQQVQAFKQLVALTGLIVTKLDGTAKGGVVIGIKKKFNIPIRYIGVGEKAQDLRLFNATDFAQSLFSI